MSDFFDELDSAYTEEVNSKPFHSIKDKGDKEVLDWLNKIFGSLEKPVSYTHLTLPTTPYV